MRDFGNTAIAERFWVLCGRVRIVRRFKCASERLHGGGTACKKSLRSVA